MDTWTAFPVHEDDLNPAPQDWSRPCLWRQPASYCCIFVSQDSGNSKLVAFNRSPQQAPPLPPSFTCPPLYERYAGPFLGTHAGFKWGPCCPRPLLAGRRHAWTHQLRIRLLLLGQSQGPRCSPQLQRATSVCVRGDEKRSQQSVSSGGHSAPSGRHHVVLAGERGEGGEEMQQGICAQG